MRSRCTRTDRAIYPRAVYIMVLLWGIFNPLVSVASAATTISDFGDISVIEYNGVYDANLDDAGVEAPRREIANEFYASHPDEYDFLLIFTNFTFAMPVEEAVAFYHGVKNDVQGIGIDIFDNSAQYGGSRLQGTIDMGNLGDLVSDPMDAKFSFTMGTLSHELLHRWAAYVSFMHAGSPSTALIGKGGSHWSYLLDTDSSLQYGGDWQDNGDGTFTCGATRKYYSPLDLYLMGMYEASEVPPMLLIENAAIDATDIPVEGVTITGTAGTVSIDDIIAAEGSRIPSATDTQKHFKIGCILLVRSGTFTGEEIYSIRTITKNWETWHSSLTDGRSTIDVDSTPLPAIPTNPGITPPSFDPRTDQAQVGEGVSWLAAQQAVNGSWSDHAQTAERDTAAVLVALDQFSGVDQNITDGLNYLTGSLNSNVDYTARKIEALYANGLSTAVLTGLLANWQNPDGGWGAGPGYTSNAEDTALAMRAMAVAGVTDTTILDPGIAYLQTQQNSNGGWGPCGGQSLVRTTSNVLETYRILRASYALEINIQNGLAWLQGKQNTDGGFGDNASTSTVYDTAWVLPMLRAYAVSSAITNAALDYLLNHQLADGSWNQNIFDTALAVFAMYDALKDPELTISADDISFTPATVTTIPASVTAEALIVNNGFTSATSVVVAVYDGPVMPSNKVTDQTIDIGATASQTISFGLTISDGRSHRFYIAIDPDNTIGESNENNNVAYKDLYPQITYPGSIPAVDQFDTATDGSSSNDTMTGSNGDDLIDGMTGDDDINGGDGNDWLVGGPGNDYLDGGPGDDTYYFEPGFGQDQITNCDSGFDGIVFGGDITEDRLQFYQDGDDLIVRVLCTDDKIRLIGWFVDDNCQLGYIQPAFGYGLSVLEIAQIMAATGPNIEPQVPDESTFDTVADRNLNLTYLAGTAGSDLLRGADVEDTIMGAEGNDWILGGNGDDLVWAGPGDDVLLGQNGGDQLDGEEGNDIMYGGPGDDLYVYGDNSGADVIHNQGGGSDWLFFDDTITEDRLTFYRYCDDLVVRIDEDPQLQVTIADWFLGEEYEVDYIQPAGGSGIPASQINTRWVWGDAEDEWTIPDESQFDNVVYGTSTNDVLTGVAGMDLLRGYEGDDQLSGLDGDDWLVGDGGNDTLDGGGGNDTQLGGDGADQLGGDAGNDRLRGGAGDDTYLYSPGAGADTIANQDGGEDWLVFTGDLTQDRLTFLKNGDDLIIRVDNDPLTQVTVTDWFAGSQYELAYVQPAGAVALTAADINLMFETPPPDDEDFTIPDAGTFDAVVNGTAAGEQLLGTNGNDLIQGFGGNDELHGFDGNDWLVGGDGNDYFNGYAGDDTILGEAGNDQLGGDPGNDRLKGGTGDDIYVFSPGSGADRIYNSDGGVDWIIFTDDLTAGRLSYYRLGDDLIVRVDNRTDEQVTVVGWFHGGEYEVDYIQPSGGVGIPAAQINQQVVVISATGDWDNDSDVDGADLAILAQYFAGGQATLADVTEFAANFGH